MAYHNKKFNCPECKKLHVVKFDLYDAQDGDEFEENVECECGCEFECSVEVEIDIELIANDPTVTKSAKDKLPKVEFDINDTSTWPPQKHNPNQLTII